MPFVKTFKILQRTITFFTCEEWILVFFIDFLAVTADDDKSFPFLMPATTKIRGKLLCQYQGMLATLRRLPEGFWVTQAAQIFGIRSVHSLVLRQDMQP
jgi:hypothetical protein